MSDADSTTSVRDRLLRDRRSLLDLSTRNRLLNVPMRTRNVRTIERVDERSAKIYRLPQDGKGLSFLPGRNLTNEERAELAEDDVDTGGIPQPEDDASYERGVARRHSDWYLRPDEELAKTRAAIVAAILEWRERDESAGVAAKPVPISFTAHAQGEDLDVVVAHIVSAPAASEPVSVPYREAAGIAVPFGVEPHIAPAREMMRIVAEIVSVEVPVHIDEVVARVRILWGLGPAGACTRSAVASAVRLAAGSGEIVAAGDFWSRRDGTVQVRDRAQVGSASLRRPEALPPAEVDAALATIVEWNYGATRNQLLLAASRAFGFSSTSAQLKGVLRAGVDRLLVSRGARRAGLLTRA